MEEIVFDIDQFGGGSSGEAFSRRPESNVVDPSLPIGETGEAASPVFRLLSRPVLPDLKHETRARLMMQSPTRLYFYWSIGPAALQSLGMALGGPVADYQLALRLLDLTRDTEELHAVGPEGSWWFSVSAGNEYRAEVGFYSATRPFVRVIFSNTVATPRKGPSPHSASEARWAVTTHKFAEVLDVSGFDEDAFLVENSDRPDELSSRLAEILAIDHSELRSFDETAVRLALEVLAGAQPVHDLRWKVPARLFALLQANLSKIPTESALQALGLAETAPETYSTVGGSLVNVPRRRFRPVSSSTF